MLLSVIGRLKNSALTSLLFLFAADMIACVLWLISAALNGRLNECSGKKVLRRNAP